MSISVLILTLNEESNLERCLQSVAWSDDIVVFDSYSSDRTLEIARAFGARVIQRRFDNERDHRAASLQVEFRHKWVFNPDADEITPSELRDEMLAIAGDPGCEVKAFRVRFKNIFMGRWIKHGSLYPTWIVRLFRPEALRFERSINLRYVVNGRVGRLRNHLLHYSFNKGLDAWFEKHNRYSRMEALEGSDPIDFATLLARDAVARRRALKALFFRLPFRPTLRFVYMYLLRGGFLDGLPGLIYCRLLMFYEYMIVLKVKEAQRRASGLPV
jgi:glycosyltransferase involved in cell wall biosynthesis